MQVTFGLIWSAWRIVAVCNMSTIAKMGYLRFDLRSVGTLACLVEVFRDFVGYADFLEGRDGEVGNRIINRMHDQDHIGGLLRGHVDKRFAAGKTIQPVVVRFRQRR